MCAIHAFMLTLSVQQSGLKGIIKLYSISSKSESKHIDVRISPMCNG